MKQSLFKVINAATDKPLFFAYQNGVKLPPKPYVTLYVISADTKLPSHRGVLDADGNRRIEAHRQALVQLDCYGGDSHSILDTLVQKLQTEAVLTLCDELNVSISNFRGIKQAPISVDDTHYQGRSVLTLNFNYVTGVAETLPIIEQAETTGEYTNG